MRKINPTLYGFQFSTGDVNYLDYGATWIRHVGKREYHFVTLTNWENSCGEQEAAEIGEKYNLQLSIVDLDKIPEDKIVDALRSCGQVPEEANGNDAWVADYVHEYGLLAPITDVNTSNFHQTFKVLAKESREISGSKSARRRAMDRKVNKLGSTAAEFMRGDINSGLIRGVIKGEESALLVAKISGLQFGK